MVLGDDWCGFAETEVGHSQKTRFETITKYFDRSMLLLAENFRMLSAIVSE